MISKKTFYILLSSALFSLTTIAYFVHLVVAAPEGSDDEYKQLRVFTDVISLIQKNYVTEVKFPDLVDGAIKGMMSSLDPHSSFMPQESYNELQVETKGEFGGLGIEITVRDGLLTVVSPIEDSPAARAGIQAGDQIIKIGDDFTRDLTLVDAVKKMRGLKGSSIVLSLHREGYADLIPVTVVRDIIKVRSIKSRMLENGYGYVKLVQFQEGSADEFSEAIKELSKNQTNKTLKGLVLDLRNNPGGLLTQAIRVADIFLEGGVVVYTDGRLESQKQKYYAHRDGDEPKFPLVILINGGSASASEIVSGALQDAGRALVVGTQSFGKGSVQTILPLEEGAALRLTTALYYTMSGRSIQAQGVTPQVVVQPKKEDKLAAILPRKESDLPGAIKNPNSNGSNSSGGVKSSAVTPPKASPGGNLNKEDSIPEKEDDKELPLKNLMTIPLKELLDEDIQLREALRLLKTPAEIEHYLGKDNKSVKL
jgi:carboxyl-terminal processing protease